MYANIGLSEKLVCLKAANFSIKSQNGFDIDPLANTIFCFGGRVISLFLQNLMN
jgi:hypothetical protein